MKKRWLLVAWDLEKRCFPRKTWYFQNFDVSEKGRKIDAKRDHESHENR